VSHNPAVIRVDPELCRAAIAAKQHQCLRLWYLAQHYNQAHERTNHVERGDFAQWLNELGAFNARQLAATIKAGQSAWWTANETRIHFVSHARLCQHLNVTPRSLKVLIPLTQFGSAKTFKAHCYAAGFVGRKASIFSRESLAKQWGQSETTLKRWEHIAGVKVTTNICEIEIPRNDQAARYPLDLDNPDTFTHWYQCKHCNYRSRFHRKFNKHLKACHPQQSKHHLLRRHAKIAWRMPNTYTSPLERTNAGSCRAIARKRNDGQLASKSQSSSFVSSQSCPSIVRYAQSDKHATSIVKHQSLRALYTFKRTDKVTDFHSYKPIGPSD
jgi:hypothetical protein